jgi:O-antigen/teichoic acid export membrane protein
MNKLFNLEPVILLQYLIGLFALSLFRFYLGILQGYRKFHIFSFGIGIKEFIMFIILVLIVKIMKLSVIEVGWSIAVSPFIALLFIWRTVKNNHIILNRYRDSKLNVQILKFILITSLIALMNQWVIRAGPLILKLIGGDKADYNAGLFSAIIMPLNLARTAVVALLTGLYPNLSRAYSMKNDNLIRRYIMRSAGIVAIIIIFIIPAFYFTGPQIVKLLYGQDYIATRSDTFLLSLVVSFFLLGMLFSKIIMARGTPKYSAISFFIGIIGLICVIIWVDLPPLKLVEAGLLICNFLYASIQIGYLFIIKLKRYLKNQKLKDRLS